MTLVQGQEDAATGQIWVYAGTKTNAGDAFDRAGLTNGTNNVVDLLDESVSNDVQFRATYGKGVPVAFNLDPVDFNQPGSAQNAEAAADGITLNRIEDGHWDPNSPRDFYFVTTEGGEARPAPGTTNSRDGGGLWRLRCRDIENPAAGGTLTLLLDGSELPLLSKPDNITIDTHGNLLIQEDPGNNATVARIVAYDLDTGRRGIVGEFDPALFAPVTPGATNAVLTADEESSGIIDAKDVLGEGPHHAGGRRQGAHREGRLHARRRQAHRADHAAPTEPGRRRAAAPPLGARRIGSMLAPQRPIPHQWSTTRRRLARSWMSVLRPQG